MSRCARRRSELRAPVFRWKCRCFMSCNGLQEGNRNIVWSLRLGVCRVKWQFTSWHFCTSWCVLISNRFRLRDSTATYKTFSPFKAPKSVVRLQSAVKVNCKSLKFWALYALTLQHCLWLICLLDWTSFFFLFTFPKLHRLSPEFSWAKWNFFLCHFCTNWVILRY